MRKITIFALCFVLFISAVGCKKSTPENAVSTESAQSTVSESKETAESPVLSEPPALTVVFNENEQIKALLGTYSWKYKDADATTKGINADAMPPLSAKAIMPYFEINNNLTVYLKWSISPDKFFVRCFDEQSFGQPNAESELICERSDIKSDLAISAKLKSGKYVYEVIAEWNGFENFKGNACYSFYTV